MKKKILYGFSSFVTVVFLTGCGGDDLLSDKNQNIHTGYIKPQKPAVIGQEYVFDQIPRVKSARVLNRTDVDAIRVKGLEYLNKLRHQTGMIPFQSESHLDTAAYNHAHYLMINYAIGHNEFAGNPGYTGADPSDRAIYVGYAHRMVSENLSSGNSSVYDSIDALFSAIYHRFGFLSFSMDEIGIGADTSVLHPYGNAYNYDMGISQLRNVCEGEQFQDHGVYFYGVCSDLQFKIGQVQYENALRANQLRNPKYVLWPYLNQADVPPVFFEEEPDPLPECSVSGYPVSIQFNESKNGEVFVDSFKLYYDANNSEITDTKLLDKKSDPNGYFSNYEYALFPMQRLDWDTKYRAVVSYTEDNIPYEVNWTFKTVALPYPYFKVTQEENTFTVTSGQTYLIYIPPKSCNDTGAGYSVRYTGDLLVESDYYDYNTIQIKVTGSSGDVDIVLQDGRNIILTVDQPDSPRQPAAITPGDNDKTPVSSGAQQENNGMDDSDESDIWDLLWFLWLMIKD